MKNAPLFRPVAVCARVGGGARQVGQMVAWLEAVGTSGGVKMLVVAADNGGVKMLVGYQLPSFTSAGSVWYDERLLGERAVCASSRGVRVG
ncbi:MAG: hypothetical protein H7839_04205, partial [Magnetococcus sp. YQC-5]